MGVIMGREEDRPSYQSVFAGRDLSAAATIRELDEWVMTRLRKAFNGEGEVKTTFFCLAMHNPGGRLPFEPWGFMIVDADGDHPKNVVPLFKKAALEYRALGIYVAFEGNNDVFVRREHKTVGDAWWKARLEKREGEATKLKAFEPLRVMDPGPFAGFLDFPLSFD